MSDPGFPDHFSGVAGAYATFRPGYPDALYRWLAEVAPGRALALDFGTGTGQAALGLAGHFERVVALDASAEQIARATAHARVEYRVAPASASRMEGARADVVAVAQALHWFDIEAFFDHADTCLRPGGVLAAWTYELLYFDDPGINRVIRHFYRGVLDGHWPPQRALVEDGYASLNWPYPKLAPPEFEIRRALELPDLLGYLGTWSAVGAYRNAEGVDPLPELKDRLEPLWDEGAREAVWPIALRAGRKPDES